MRTVPRVRPEPNPRTLTTPVPLASHQRQVVAQIAPMSRFPHSNRTPLAGHRRLASRDILHLHPVVIDQGRGSSLAVAWVNPTEIDIVRCQPPLLPLPPSPRSLSAVLPGTEVPHLLGAPLLQPRQRAHPQSPAETLS